jgi:nitrogen fixation NifU-like protein
MDEEIQELYQQIILDHGRNPRNLRAIEEGAPHRAEGYNPLCGDHVVIYARSEDQRLVDISFTGKGCAICTASTSMMTQLARDHTEQEAAQMFERFHALLAGEEESPSEETEQLLGKLTAFAGVRRYPIRVKCATLPWHTLKAALEQQEEPVSTE